MFQSANFIIFSAKRAFLFLFITFSSFSVAVAQDPGQWFVDEAGHSRDVEEWMNDPDTIRVRKYKRRPSYRRNRHQYSHHDNGFGRLFPPSVFRRMSMHQLRRLSLSMKEPRGRYPHKAGYSETPAGYTFLGQFIDHDIVLDTKSMLSSVAADGKLENIRTVDLDLDSIYAGGPEETPFLYNLPYLRVGKRIFGYGLHARFDLLRTYRSRKPGPRGGEARALIGDPRNDENFIIAQLHAAFISFHNGLVDILIERRYGHLRHRFCRRHYKCGPRHLAAKISKRDRKVVFEKAREHVIHYYHRIIAEDFLPRVIGENRTYDILVKKRRFFFPNGFRKRGNILEKAYIPYEFSGAAFRYGHSQVGDVYQIQKGVRRKVLDIGRKAFKPLHRNSVVDWRYFFPIEPYYIGGFNFARKIDTKIARSLYDLERSNVVSGERITSLPLRNLVRDQSMRLPTGRYVASRMLPIIFSDSDARYRDYGNRWNKALIRPNRQLRRMLRRPTIPLWYYILQEAERYGVPYQSSGRLYLARSRTYRHRYQNASYRDRYVRKSGTEIQGHTLGPVGGTIVGEVLVGLLEYYDRKTGKGLKYRPEIQASLDPNPDAPLSLTKVRKGRIRRTRYMMRNLLIDAGVAWLPRPKARHRQ